MKHKKRIQSLHRTDEATAGIIMQQYPAQWDMDRVFQRAYQGYLLQKKESLQTGMQFGSEFSETAECTIENGISRRIRRVGGYAALAAVSIGVFLFIFRTPLLSPPVDHIPDGRENNNITTTEFDFMETTDTAEETLPETTAVSENILEVTTTFTVETTTDTVEESRTETTTETVVTVTASAVTAIESTLPQAVETVIPEIAETSSTVTETTTTESTEETTTTVETTTVPGGYFEVEEASKPGDFFRVFYVRETNTAVVEHEHSFEAEGFTLTDVQVNNPDQDYQSMTYRLEDAAGQSYLVRQDRYDYFGPGFNPESYPLRKSYTIGDKTVFLVYREDPESVCHLMWDDGCHVSEVISQYKDLAQMELLVLGQTTN